MADQLSSENAGRGHNGLPFTQEQYEKWKERYEACDQEVAAAVGSRKDLRSVIKGIAGKEGLKAFDAARREAKMPGNERLLVDQYKRQMLEWEKKPIGFQPGFDLEFGAPPAMLNLDADELAAIERQGFDAGRKGMRADRNPWNPMTKPHEIWLESWTAGQAEKVQAEIKTAEEPRRGPGRPRKAETAAPPNGSSRPRRVLSEEQKKAMQEGRQRARALKEGNPPADEQTEDRPILQ